jgi:hypothetical protein
MIMNAELVEIWQEAVMTYMTIIPWHLHDETYENHEKTE